MGIGLELLCGLGLGFRRIGAPDHVPFVQRKLGEVEAALADEGVPEEPGLVHRDPELQRGVLRKMIRRRGYEAANPLTLVPNHKSNTYP